MTKWIKASLGRAPSLLCRWLSHCEGGAFPMKWSQPRKEQIEDLVSVGYIWVYLQKHHLTCSLLQVRFGLIVMTLAHSINPVPKAVVGSALSVSGFQQTQLHSRAPLIHRFKSTPDFRHDSILRTYQSGQGHLAVHLCSISMVKKMTKWLNLSQPEAKKLNQINRFLSHVTFS